MQATLMRPYHRAELITTDSSAQRSFGEIYENLCAKKLKKNHSTEARKVVYLETRLRKVIPLLEGGCGNGF